MGGRFRLIAAVEERCFKPKADIRPSRGPPFTKDAVAAFEVDRLYSFNPSRRNLGVAKSNLQHTGKSVKVGGTVTPPINGQSLLRLPRAQSISGDT